MSKLILPKGATWESHCKYLNRVIDLQSKVLEDLYARLKSTWVSDASIYDPYEYNAPVKACFTIKAGQSYYTLYRRTWSGLRYETVAHSLAELQHFAHKKYGSVIYILGAR